MTYVLVGCVVVRFLLGRIDRAGLARDARAEAARQRKRADDAEGAAQSAAWMLSKDQRSELAAMHRTLDGIRDLDETP